MQAAEIQRESRGNLTYLLGHKLYETIDQRTKSYMVRFSAFVCL